MLRRYLSAMSAGRVVVVVAVVLLGLFLLVDGVSRAGS